MKAGNLINTITENGEIIYFSIVQKQTDSGLCVNERLFVLCEGNFFGYMARVDKKNQLKNFDSAKLKSIVPITSIKKIEQSNLILCIKFAMIESNKSIEKKWKLHIPNNQVLENWAKLLRQSVSIGIENTKGKIRENLIKQKTQLKYKIFPKEKQIPESLLCPISQVLMIEPVLVTTCGHSFQGCNIREWIKIKPSCPLCKKIIDDPQKGLMKNFALFDTIAYFKQ